MILTATAIWTVGTVVPLPHLFWLQDVGAVALTLASSVVICHVLRRQRAAVESAERERKGRAESLHEANRRLEQGIREHQRTEDALRLALRELDHRVKNTLVTVQSVADQTLRSSSSMREFGAAFYGRIQAMARIHTALAGSRREGLAASELATNAAKYGALSTDEGRVATALLVEGAGERLVRAMLDLAGNRRAP